MEFLNLSKLLSGNYYAVPDYQRDYEWGTTQNSTLIEDVFSIIEDKDENDHFVGAIVTIPYEEDTAVNKSIDLKDYSIGNDNVKHVVDGQQRLTSLSILMQALWDNIQNDDALTDTQKKKQDKFERLLQGDDYNAKDDRAPRLILNGNTGYYYNNKVLRVNNDSFNLVYRGAKRVKAAYDLFDKAIKEQKDVFISEGICVDENDFYKKMADVLTRKIVLVEIVCGASSNAFQVFDSLNGKGLDLTAADRIKNILLSWSPKGKGAQKWEAFVACVGEEYLTNFFVSLFFSAKGKRIAKNKLPDTFKELYRESAMSDFDFFYRNLCENGTLYGELRNCKTSNNKVNKLLKDLTQLKSDQVFVLLFAAGNKYSKTVVDTKEYYLFVKALLNLIVRMQICEKSTNRLDTIFSKCVELMQNGGASLSVITKKISDEMNSLVSDAEFKLGFERFAPSDNKLCEYYLRSLENYERKKLGNRTEVESGLTVEHIIPKTLDDLTEWYGKSSIPDEIEADFKDSVVERIGNKALLYGDDNSSASNNDYVSKINVYKNGKRGQSQGTPVGTFYLINELLTKYPNKFNHDEVNDRAKFLASYAVEIWK